MLKKKKPASDEPVVTHNNILLPMHPNVINGLKRIAEEKMREFKKTLEQKKDTTFLKD